MTKSNRLQGLTKELSKEIIISEATHERLEDDFPLKKLPATKVKGKAYPVEIFALT